MNSIKLVFRSRSDAIVINLDNYDKKESDIKIKSVIRNKESPDKYQFIWSLVGNIVAKHEFGENHEIKKGTKHFPPGAKVFCIPEFGGMGHERITVVGIPRRSSKYIKVVIASTLVENWRVKKVFHPHVRKLLVENWWWIDDDESQKDVVKYVKSFLKYPKR